MAELVPHVAAFVRIVNASQTTELLEWTAESLERALAWARAMEELAAKTTRDGDAAAAALDSALARHLHGATLPTMARQEPITTRTLKEATRLVCEAVLSSPWIRPHPIGSVLVSRALQTGLAPSDPSIQSNGYSSWFTNQTRTHRSLRSLEMFAREIGDSSETSRVQVHSTTFSIPSLTSVTLSSRALRLQSLARTLQKNAVAARSIPDPRQYTDFLSLLNGQLQQSDAEVLEVIVWAAVLEWPSHESSGGIRSDMIASIEKWASSQPTQSIFLLGPRPAALLARACPTFASQYLSCLFLASLRFDKDELRARIGALVLQGAGLEDDVEARIAALDPVSREQLLRYLAI